MLKPRGINETTAQGNAWRVGRMSFLRRFGFDNIVGWTHMKLGILASWQSQTQGGAFNIAPNAVGNNIFAIGFCNASAGPYAPSFKNPTLHWVGFGSTPGVGGISSPWGMSAGAAGAGAGRLFARYVKNGAEPYLDASSHDVYLRSDARSLIGLEVIKGTPNWTVRLTGRTLSSTNNNVTDLEFDTWLNNTSGLGAPANHNIDTETGLTNATVNEATYGVFDAISIYVDRAYFPLMIHRMEVRNLVAV
jgi:hypothetical protein